ncbi:MAG TPA: SGNH/GDSL hydrolase family protein [Ignavibacteria bacterium]|nr:SGNH/GDSL hydrolase family protein [Ignavibacteria bacterium]
MIIEKTEKHRFDYIALGDSYTVGESVGDDERFPAQLVKRLSADSIDVADPLIIAKTGWTTDELIAAIKEKNVKDTFDIVTLLIGVNNQYRGRSAEEYRVELKQLIETALKFAGGKKERVFIISIPDWGVTPFAEGREWKKIAEDIDEFNKVKKEEAENYGISFYDITEISRIDDPALIAPDGLHPSGKMYKMWVDKFYNDVKAVLK